MNKTLAFVCVLIAVAILWPIPHCYMNGQGWKWLPERGIVCWVERK